MKKIKFILVLLTALTLCSGCASLRETWHSFAGTSTKELEEGRNDAIKKEFDCDYVSCRQKVEAILADIKAYVYAKDETKKMIAIYVSRKDTTVVGVFFKDLDSAKTKVEVSSPSTYAKELIAGKIFSALEEQCSPQNEEPIGELKEEAEEAVKEEPLKQEEAREQSPDEKNEEAAIGP